MPAADTLNIFYNDNLEKLQEFARHITDNDLGSEIYEQFLNAKAINGMTKLIENKKLILSNKLYRSVVDGIIISNWESSKNLIDILIESKYFVKNNTSLIHMALEKRDYILVKRLANKGVSFDVTAPVIFCSFIGVGLQRDTIAALTAMLAVKNIKEDKFLIRLALSDAERKRLCNVTRFLKKQL